MQTAKDSRDKLWVLQNIITKMPLTVCCSTAVPEFGVRWKEVARTIRNCRMPMQSCSVAQVLCRYFAKSLSEEELDDIIARLRLKMISIQSRTWHVLHLDDPTDDEPDTDPLQMLPQRLLTALQHSNKGVMTPEVNSVMMGDLIYLSVQFVSHIKKSSKLYIAIAPGEPVALISSLAGAKVLKACVDGPNPPLLTELTVNTVDRCFDPSLMKKTISLTFSIKCRNLAETLRAWVLKGAISPDSEFINTLHITRSNHLTYNNYSDSE